MGVDMGIGILGFNNLVFKRKFRFLFELSHTCGSGKPLTVPRHFVKVAARPSFTMEETEINYLNAKYWIPGKLSWEAITVTWFDVAYKDISPLYQWISYFADLSQPRRMHQGSQLKDWEAQGVLTLLDGCGETLETWTLNHVFPVSVNFGTLEYASSEEVTIEMSLRYSDVEYESKCPSISLDKCCTPCG